MSAITERQSQLIKSFIITQIPKIVNGQHKDVIAELRALKICEDDRNAHLAYLDMYPEVLNEYRDVYATQVKDVHTNLSGVPRKDISKRKGKGTFSSKVREHLNDALDKLEKDNSLTLKEVVNDAYDKLFEIKRKMRNDSNGKGFHKHSNENTEFTYIRSSVRIEIKRALPQLILQRGMQPILPSEAFALTRSRTWNVK